MSLGKQIRVFLKTTNTGRVLAALYRFKTAAGYHVPQNLPLPGLCTRAN
jgi:hypothetical protein